MNRARCNESTAMGIWLFFLVSAQPVFLSGSSVVEWVTGSRLAFHQDSKKRSNSFCPDILPGYWSSK